MWLPRRRSHSAGTGLAVRPAAPTAVATTYYSDAPGACTTARAAALEKVLTSGTAGARYHAAQTLMRRYTTADFPKLAPILDHAEGDARIGAAWAILQIAPARK